MPYYDYTVSPTGNPPCPWTLLSHRLPGAMKQVHLYVLRRILLHVLIFFISVSVFFFVIMLSPGNEKPLGPLYLAYMKQLFLERDFGRSSLAFPDACARPDLARTTVVDRTAWRVAVVLAWVLGLAIGTVVGWKRGTALDSTLTPIGLVASQIPPYLLALVLVMGLVYGARLFPSGGAYSPSIPKGFSVRYIGSMIHHAILPSLTLILVYTFTWMLFQRALVINLLREDYMILAEAKGLRRSRLISRYILRNTLLPQATGLALRLGFVVNGFYLIEWIYRYPGIGKLFVSAIRQRDYNVMLGVTIITMALVLVANLLIELIYPLIDPRIRRGGE